MSRYECLPKYVEEVRTYGEVYEYIEQFEKVFVDYNLTKGDGTLTRDGYKLLRWAKRNWIYDLDFYSYLIFHLDPRVRKNWRGRGYNQHIAYYLMWMEIHE